MPSCEETHYTVGVSAAPFRQCNNKNLGMTSLCDLESHGDMAGIDPPIWGASVLRQYAEGGQEAPDYIAEAVHTNERSYISASEVCSCTRCGSNSWTGFFLLCFSLFATGFGPARQASKFSVVEFSLLSQQNLVCEFLPHLVIIC